MGNTQPGEILVFVIPTQTAIPTPAAPGRSEEGFQVESITFQSTQGAKTMNAINTETQAAYFVTQTDDAIIAQALSILDCRMRRHGEAMSSPAVVKNFLRLKLAEIEHEVFCILFLDSQNRVISFEEMFRGTLSQASVYPREIVKAALLHNAAAVILSHNHPSGEAEPSRADLALTDALKNALALVDVKVLDHFIIADTVLSFAERGLI
jgi:DNA repair protein RadC